MKMIGISIRSATSFWRSRPLRSGRETSSIRQFGVSARGRARNSCADAKTSGCQPAKRISNSSDSRTDMSSSTTNTIGVAGGMGDDPNLLPGARSEFIYHLVCKGVSDRSVHPECGIYRVKQSRIAERLEKALRRTLFEHSRADSLISLSGDEDDRNLLPANHQFLLKVRSTHPRH